MKDQISGSIVANSGSEISNSKNVQKINFRKIYTTSALISFIVGIISSLVATYIWEILK